MSKKVISKIRTEKLIEPSTVVMSSLSQKNSLRKRILLIDDDTQFAEHFRSKFAGDCKCDFDIEVCSSYEDILAKEDYLSFLGQFDLLVLDILMPGMDGLVFYEEFLSSKRLKVPFIFLTNLEGNDPRLEKGWNSPAQDLVFKGRGALELQSRLNRALNSMATLERATLGNLFLIPDFLTAEIGDQSIELNRKEWIILRQMMEDHPTETSREHVVYLGWLGLKIMPGTFRAYIHQLNKKLQSWEYHIVQDSGVLRIVRKN